MPQFPVQQEVPNLSTPAYHCESRYGYAWVALEEPLAPILDADEEHDPKYRRIPQFYEVWNTSAFRLMENSFDNAHFAFVHKGTFGQLNQPLPEKYEIVETDYGFEAETLITVANPPVQHRISGTTAPTTKRHMRNKWYMPFCRKLDIEYPSGLRHIIFNPATPIDDNHIMVVQWLYRNDTEADCSGQGELIDWDFQITREDKDIIESTDYDDADGHGPPRRGAYGVRPPRHDHAQAPDEAVRGSRRGRGLCAAQRGRRRSGHRSGIRTHHAAESTASPATPKPAAIRSARLLGEISGIDFTTDLTDLKRRLARSLLVQPDPQRAAQGQARRHRGDAEGRERGHPRRRGLRQAPHSAHRARRRHRQLRPVRADGRRRRAR